MLARTTLAAAIVAACLNGCALLTVADAALAVTVTAASVAAEAVGAGASLALEAVERDEERPLSTGDDE